VRGTLKSRRAFGYIYENGERAVGKHVVVFAVPDDEILHESSGAVGFVASRKVGHSPDRSRAKRVMRAAFAEIRTRHDVRGHLILVARRAMIEDGIRSNELASELEQLLSHTRSLKGAKE
jgi:ribonuclease P protein component